MVVLRSNKVAKSSETSRFMLSSRRDRPSLVAVLSANVVTTLVSTFILSA